MFCLKKNTRLNNQGRIQGGQWAKCPPQGGQLPPWGVWKGKTYGDKHWKKSDNWQSLSLNFTRIKAIDTYLYNDACNILKNIHRKKESKTRLWKKFYVLFVDFISFIFSTIDSKKFQRQNCLLSFKSEIFKI